MADANTTPAIEGSPRLWRRYHTHNPENGRNDNIDGFDSAATPHSAPKMAQPFHPCQSSSSRDTKTIRLSNSGVSVVSQTQCMDQYIV